MSQSSRESRWSNFNLYRVCLRTTQMSVGGEVANALVCKTGIRGFDSRPALQRIVCFARSIERV